mgnify:CR=1 FL=1
MVRLRLDKSGRSGTAILGRRCNLQCIWCHYDYFDHSSCNRPAISNEMFADAVTRILDAMNEDEATIRIAGNGEPTLVGCAELLHLIQLLRRVPMVRSIHLTTNGVLLRDMIVPLQEAGLDGVTISLSSLDRQIYHFYTGADCLDQVRDSISKCVEVGLSTKINVIYSKLNAREVPDFVNLVRSNKDLVVKYFDLLCANELDRRLHLPLKSLEQQLAPYADQISDNNSAYASRQFSLTGGGIVLAKLSQENNCPNLTCPARNTCLEGCRNSIRIRLDGVMQPCGVRRDNTIDLFSPVTTARDIRQALRSGGKLHTDIQCFSGTSD